MKKIKKENSECPYEQNKHNKPHKLVIPTATRVKNIKNNKKSPFYYVVVNKIYFFNHYIVNNIKIIKEGLYYGAN